ncbi:single-stranded DNA-binding protein [Mycetocola manganoxydans]|uniref:Single-stranded DNA-binding protein n=1 Tax=Mycetocola manganoxydans TaxID=699879 RepID=A0A3L6ZN98_9MICO|nr:single-stranded DNA-binding protein [Mycetocola manganoxydans]RLP69374.1 single-stranded DNA-binding protein [Mycetocola manganoxydans]GHD50827.1 hypothetical protein GCM10008097_25240 [Mycetocola manganoxydans]
MSTRTVTGNLAADPEVVQAGNIQITKLRIIENTGDYRQGKWQAHPDATTHFVEAKFELGENVAATLHKGDPVIVVGRERTTSWGSDGSKQYGRIIEADNVGVDLSRATAQVRRTGKGARSAESAGGAPKWNVAPIGQGASENDASSGFVGFGGDITAELANARAQLASAQALNDYEAITYWTRAIVDLDRADEGRG